MFYGWQHKRGRTATATKWLAFFYLPLLPLGRYRVRMPKPPKKGGMYALKELMRLAPGPIGFAVWGPVHTEFRATKKMPFNFGEALWTYAKAYLVLPLTFILPAALAAAVCRLLDQGSEPGFWLSVFALLGMPLYWLILIAYVLNRARYGPMAKYR
jgi:hypothetical protein